MSYTEYPNAAPTNFDGYREDRTMTWLRATAIIGGGSALLWGLILYAVWQLI